MRFFWPSYLFAAVAGTAAVYVAAPLARPYVRRLFPAPAFHSPAPRSPSPVSVPSVPSGPSGTSAPSGPSGLPGLPGLPETSGPSGTSAPSGLPDPSDDSAPALQGIYLANRREKPGWGITHQQAAVFSPDGTHLRQVPGGTLLEYRARRASSKGGMIECLLVQEESLSPPRLVSQGDVFLFTGSYKRLSGRQLSDLQAYYTLSGKIGLRKNELLRVSAVKNPFFTAYQAAYKRLTEHIDASRALAARRDSAAEEEKTRLENQLREMKVMETRLRAEYNAEHARFRAWKEQHAAELPVLEDDPSIRQWRQEMAQLRASIPGLAY